MIEYADGEKSTVCQSLRMKLYAQYASVAYTGRGEQVRNVKVF